MTNRDIQIRLKDHVCVKFSHVVMKISRMIRKGVIIYSRSKREEVHYLSTDMTYILFEDVIRIVVILVKISGVEFLRVLNITFSLCYYFYISAGTIIFWKIK